jgi:hypothetical protein
MQSPGMATAQGPGESPAHRLTRPGGNSPGEPMRSKPPPIGEEQVEALDSMRAKIHGSGTEAVVTTESEDTRNSGPTTRAKKGIHRPQIYTDGTVKYGKQGFLTHSGEPYFIDDTLADKNWKIAMDSEYDASMKNKTWHLVPPPNERKKYYRAQMGLQNKKKISWQPR